MTRRSWRRIPVPILGRSLPHVREERLADQWGTTKAEVDPRFFWTVEISGYAFRGQEVRLAYIDVQCAKDRLYQVRP
jgi:hypothetical protein